MELRASIPVFASSMRAGLALAAVTVLGAALGGCTTTNCGTGGGGGGGDGGVDAAVTYVCGNGVCEVGETQTSCSADCRVITPVCGNGTCEAGETSTSCPADCHAITPVCGNGTCEAGESPTSCPVDCSVPGCGDGVCAPGEICPVDCGLGCPAVAGAYTLEPAPGSDPSCPPDVSEVTVTQSGCSVTVTNVFPTPITFGIDPVGTGVYPYSMGGVSGTLTFAFTPPTFFVTDSGPFAACPGIGTRH